MDVYFRGTLSPVMLFNKNMFELMESLSRMFDSKDINRIGGGAVVQADSYGVPDDKDRGVQTAPS